MVGRSCLLWVKSRHRIAARCPESGHQDVRFW
jgi:hypothetical protein